MTDEPTPADSAEIPTRRQAISPDDALPPVETPGAGFILQLFIVPGIIVTVIVMVWMMFSWLARGSDDPRLLIRKLSVPNEQRFQAAHELAGVLHNKRHADLKRDPEAAAELARILAQQLKEGGDGEREVNLRIFICRALGSFQVNEGLDELILATDASAQKHLRQAAVIAIAFRAEHASKLDPPQQIGDARLTQTMLALADDREPLVREATAVALGWIGGEPLLAKLEEMLDDVNPNVRYNAATSCARLGNAAAIDVLAEMLDPDNPGVTSEPDERLQGSKRIRILINALRATQLLADAHAEADLSLLEGPIAKLADSSLDKQIQLHAANVLNRLKKRASSAAP